MSGRVQVPIYKIRNAASSEKYTRKHEGLNKTDLLQILKQTLGSDFPLYCHARSTTHWLRWILILFMDECISSCGTMYIGYPDQPYRPPYPKPSTFNYIPEPPANIEYLDRNSTLPDDDRTRDLTLHTLKHNYDCFQKFVRKGALLQLAAQYPSAANSIYQRPLGRPHLSHTTHRISLRNGEATHFLGKSGRSKPRACKKGPVNNRFTIRESSNFRAPRGHTFIEEPLVSYYHPNTSLPNRHTPMQHEEIFTYNHPLLNQTSRSHSVEDTLPTFPQGTLPPHSYPTVHLPDTSTTSRSYTVTETLTPL